MLKIAPLLMIALALGTAVGNKGASLVPREEVVADTISELKELRQRLITRGEGADAVTLDDAIAVLEDVHKEMKQ